MMEIITVPIVLVVASYIIRRLVGRLVWNRIAAIVQESQFGLTILVLVIPTLASLILVVQGPTTAEALNDHTTAVIQLMTTFIANHIISFGFGAVAAIIGGLIVATLVKPFMDAFDR